MQDSQITITVTAVDGATKVFEGVGDAAVKQANRAANAWIKANDVANVSVKSAGQAAAGTDKAAAAQDRLAKATKRSYFAQTALTTVLSAGINKLFLEMVDVTGRAIKQTDLLANFPATMVSMGQSASAATESIKQLSRYVGQIGGDMGTATSMVARFTDATKDVKAATAIFAGVNNALIAGDASIEEQRLALIQFAQALERGKPDMREWLSLTQNMSFQLGLVAKEMGYVNANSLGEALRSGKASMGEFTTELTKLATGTGPIAQQAMARMNGMQFAFSVFKNTMVNGMTEIIQTIGRQNIVEFFNVLGGAFRQLTVWAVQLIQILFTLFNVISGLFGGPQLKLAKDNTAGIASNLGNAAGGAKDLADGLDDAGKAAKKTAGQLASFDKMNVLSEKSDSGGGGKDAGAGAGGAGFNPSEVGELSGIFDNITGKIGEISTASKILAGILASIAGIKFAKGLLNQFNGLSKTVQETGKNIDNLKEKLKGTGSEGNIFKRIGEGALRLPIIVAGSFDKIGGSVAKLGRFLLTPVGAILAIAGAIGVLYATNEDFKKGWDKAWTPIYEGINKFWKIIEEKLNQAFGDFAKEWDKFVKKLEPIRPVLDWIGDRFNDFVGWLKDLGIGFDEVNSPMEMFGNILGTIVAGAAAIVLGIFGTFVDVLVSIVSGFVNIATAVVWFVNTAGDLIAKFIEGTIGFFKDLWTNITNTFKNVGKWFEDRFKEASDWVKQAWSNIVKFFTDIWDSIVEVFTDVGNWFGDRFGEAWTNITNIWDGAKKFFTDTWNNIKKVFSDVKKWFEDRFKEAWDAVKGAFSPTSVVDFFNGVWKKITNIFGKIGKSVGDAVGTAFKNAVNGVLSFIEGTVNTVVDRINGMLKVIDDAIPGDQSWLRVPKVSLPRLAKGGVVTQRTFAEIGEAGTEAVVPLENNTEWIDKLAAKINSAGGGSRPVQLVVQIGEETITTKLVDLINEQTQMTGRNVITV